MAHNQTAVAIPDKTAACAALLLTLAALTLAGCGSSFGHTPTPANLHACLAQRLKLAPVLLGPPRAPQQIGAGSVVQVRVGGPFQRGSEDVEAPAYDIYVYLFDSPAAAVDAMSKVHRGSSVARYPFGRALVVDEVAFIVSISSALPQPTSTAVRSCLAATRYA